MSSVARSSAASIPEPGRTQAGSVALLVGAGIVAALQVGKAAIAVPLLTRDLGLGLGEIAWVLSAYGVLGALGGLPVGLAVPGFGPARAIVAGLLAIACGSAAGALAQGAGVLIAARAFEGCGYLAIAVSVPTLLRSITAARDRDLVFALWGTFMPTGTAIMLVVATVLAPIGWRGLWLANAALAAAYALLLLSRLPRRQAAAPRGLGAVLRETPVALRRPGPLLLGSGFAVYTFQYYAVSGFLPVLLVDRLGLSVPTAGLLSAGAVAMNALGNVTAGALIRRGVPLWLTVGTAFATVGVTSLGIFAVPLPALSVAVLAAISLGMSGVIPGSIFAAAPRVAPTPVLLSVTLGLIVQASNLGQLVGPALLGAWVQRFGWSAAPILLVPVAAAGLALAFVLRVLLRQAR